MMRIVECVPNFSEGKNKKIIGAITDSISAVKGVTLLDVDPGEATNRTVVTFVGDPDAVIEAAFQAVKKASELIDMRHHKGAHPRMGATDVCPFVPVSGVTMDDCVEYSKILAKRVGEELKIPVFLYENSASTPERRNLANIREGEYEGMAEKMKTFRPDFGPKEFNAKSGCTAIGAREFLIAYNVNLNTKNYKKANAVAFDIRERGRSGQPGLLKHVKAIGWFVDDYNIAQVSINLTNYIETPLHKVFDACCEKAAEHGLRVTGSEIVGLVPLKAMVDAGRYFLKKQGQCTGVPEKDLVDIAIRSMGLRDVAEFDPMKKIIEYRVGNLHGKLVSMKVHEFADELSSDSPAPGGGSVSALAGGLAAGLASMVANLTMGKKFKDKYEEMDRIAVKAQDLKKKLMRAIDEDTEAFNELMNAFSMPKNEKREKAILEATKKATLVPFNVCMMCREILDLSLEIAKNGNPNAASDAGVSAELASAGARGAAMNVKINLKNIDDPLFRKRVDTSKIIKEADELLLQVRKEVGL